ncbi:glycosyltransferase family 2 protein [Pseudoroseicyclus aestuarii]|uniref:Cellulose synthase/poly-beta-1,6-N-acetylglucosamine synthase-like glycosyltransferase n=1 Tax=Pseudoroseicyclus aestuarii TaxID=1795041 RepID=A0A318SM82_9RHOB|nr:glycosyltransferase family 2 protein [Pseudoroseicyclus aestuarii]PYE80913.1 cellulose synthase/poly-beta-1,6-N-acetylglucosamine synthase-like glycosyltransferase [Pseudoroseicyclus aestuarii]
MGLQPIRQHRGGGHPGQLPASAAVPGRDRTGFEPGLRPALAAALHRRQRPANSPPLQVDPLEDPPDAALIAALGPALALEMGALPWRRCGAATVVLTAGTPLAPHQRRMLTARLGPVRLAQCPVASLRQAMAQVVEPALVAQAETCVPEGESCRSSRPALTGRIGITLAASAVLWGALSPASLALSLTLLSVATLVSSSLLRLAAALAAPLRVPKPPLSNRFAMQVAPVVSIFVPLYKEQYIAQHLLVRLSRLDYPQALLDICLILEDDDHVTRAAIEAVELPPQMRVIEVPEGKLRTKPRAMNYALRFARGSIIGIYDAEDAPAPDQITRVAERFAKAPPEVACLQGALDFYNTRTNWITRCFTLEYNGWFRVVLPGLARLGLVVPLGGTKLFLRRAALEAVGCWDAWNVTEDADLGLRLARRGYRTELIDTTTQEEATAHPWAWVRQRSRWLKGYGMTWAVAMRQPRRLWADLGPTGFVALNVLLLGTLLQFLLAPVLWSFWLLFLGLPHPIEPLLPNALAWSLALLFLGSEVLVIAVAGLGAVRAEKRGLLIWTVALSLYFPMATLAAWKAVWEIGRKPFFWDKTTHGLVLPPPDIPLNRPLQPSPRRASAA